MVFVLALPCDLCTYGRLLQHSQVTYRWYGGQMCCRLMSSKVSPC